MSVSSIQNLVIQRIYLHDSTLGVLSVDGLDICFTVELPYLGNKRLVSAIPAGKYKIEKTTHIKFGQCFFIHDVLDRSGVFIHVANRTSEIKGCIAPNLILNKDFVSGSDSKGAMRKLLDAVNDNCLHNLEIF